jgi:prolipoprotein diacylglyceryl transferase
VRIIIASIPSPSFNSIDIGPLSINLYGLFIALGVVAAIWLFGRRLEERGAGTSDDASAIGLWAVLAGVIGARLYHVATDWHRFEDDLDKIPAIWEGGLGIPGGLLVGIPVGLFVAHRKGISVGMAATCAAPAIPLAQSIGRWGNYFNQELYGGPTDLPWALEIDAAHLEPGYVVGTTFHPTFLYESLWTLGLCFLLLWIDRRFRPALGQLMVMYVIGYGVGRFWIEGLRIDTADELGGLRWNQWVALVAVISGVIVLAAMRRVQVSPVPITASVGGKDDDHGDGDAESDDDDEDPGGVDAEPDGEEEAGGDEEPDAGDGDAEDVDGSEPDDSAEVTAVESGGSDPDL